MSTPAGWYDDGSGQKRWWDGSGWTTHVAAPVAPEPVAPEPAPFVPPFTPPAAAPQSPAVPQYTSAPQFPSAPAYPSAPGHPSHPSAAQFPPPSPATGTPVVYDGYALPAASPAPFPAIGLAGLVAAGLGAIVACIPQIPLLGWLLLGAGFVLSIVSLFLRARKWAGIAGLAVAVLGALIAAVLAFVAEVSPAGSSSADDVPGSEVIYASDLEVGDCLPEGLDGEEFLEVTTVPCDGPHLDEIYYEFTLPDGDFPGEDALADAAIRECEPEFEDFADIAYEDSELDYWWLTPTETSWAGGDRTMQCLIYSYDGTVTGTLEGVAR
ncbi:septum formation family protein [Microbacterium sp. NPDC090003]|uniref:septum formation family protein n=1 Tax=Microbacterium sp. NPDC090003 TaxID=3364203 RepID=UPI00382AD5A6